MSYDYSENILIQESAGNLLQNELGWDVKFAYNKEILGKDGTFGRNSYKEILLVRYFREALKRLNPWIDDKQINEAQSILEERLSSASLMQINEKNYFLIRDGISVKDNKSKGKTTTKKAMLIDFQNPNNNYFLAVKELKIHGELYRRRTDIVGFVNGIPLLFIELKKYTVDVQNAYEDNYTDYLDTIPHLFYYNAFLMLSNGTEAKVGTLGSKYEFFHEWKRLQEKDAGSVALSTMLMGICKKENFLDLFENFILFDHSNGHTAKILARNHQYLGVNEAVKAYNARKLNSGKLGVFWHTQGSGKSYSMVFLAQKILRKFAGSPTFVILTDRDELNSQISETFENCNILGKTPISNYIATSGEDLIRKLQGNPSFIFTLIQKFNTRDVQPIYPDHDIIIMSDEAHRSQYGLFADNMMRLLPTAARIGFTGTPLLSSDNITARTFGGYISIYDFKRAVEDGATVPLYYENRGEKILNLQNPEITEQILDAIERADLDADQQEKLEAEFAKEIHVLTAEPRLRSIAKDFVNHYSDLWTSGKAMFVCLNKITCIRMYNYVQEYWAEEIKQLEELINISTQQQEVQELKRKLAWMKSTKMAVVISQEQNEIKTFKKWGLDIKPHREKIEKNELDKEFKDSKNPLRIVFVCAMWLTGFDVKSLSCLYLDKPLKAHTLMQTIARANRVNEGKNNGLIIDYIGIVKALRKALADYTANQGNTGGIDPTIDKEVLISRIAEVIHATKLFLSQKNFILDNLVNAMDFDKLSYILEGVNVVCDTIEDKKIFTTYASELNKLIKYIDRADITAEMRKEYEAIAAIYAKLQKKRKHVDTTDLMVEINGIISHYLQVQPSSSFVNESSARYDISAIDFDILRREFAKTKTKNLVMKDLQDLIEQRLRQLISRNRNRIDYYERYQKIIEEYNKEQDHANIEKTFQELMDIVRTLTDEEQRYAREGFDSDEELSLYDMLFRDDLTKADIKKIKEIASSLLHKIKAKISEMDHWTDKQETKAEIDNIIRNTLWEELPACYDEYSISQYRQQIYEYVYTHYQNIA